MNTPKDDRAYFALNYLASAILIGIVLVLALHKSGSAESDLVFGRWSSPFLKVLLTFLGIAVAHFALFKYAKIGRKILFPRVIMMGMSLFFTLIVLEVGLRILPVSVEGAGLNSHPVLVRKFDSGAPGHDMWGWRNETVPESADFVFVGASQTYGNIVSREDAFPQVFGRLSGASTYNLALGGYGPLEYWWIYNEYGQQLKPDIVVVELFLGNDITDVIELQDHLSDFEIDGQPFEDVQYDDSAKKMFDAYEHLTSQVDRGLFVEGSFFLRERSKLFKLLDGGYRFSRSGFEYFEEFDTRLNKIRDSLTTEENMIADLQVFFPYEDENIKTVFTPVRRLIPVFSGKSDIDRAIPVMEQTIARLNDVVSSQGGEMVVLLMPMKEVVYHPYLQKNQIALPPSYDLLIDLVTQVKSRVTQTWQEQGICVIDVTSDLQSTAMDGNQLFPEDLDGHYNEQANSVIAAALLKHFQDTGASGSPCPVWP